MFINFHHRPLEISNVIRIYARRADLTINGRFEISQLIRIGFANHRRQHSLTNRRVFAYTPLIIGVFFTVCGIMNLSSVPHPAWFPFVDLPVYLILALVAGLLLKRKGDTAGEATA